jgi:hypothetical protein
MQLYQPLGAMLLAAALAFPAFAQDGPRAEARNMRLLGHNDLQARSAYQPVIHRQGDRWIAYIGHYGDERPNPLNGGKMEPNGTSIVDVSDPKKPLYLAHIPGEPGRGVQGGAQMVRMCPGSELPNADRSRFHLLRTFGHQAHEIWDVTDPAKPALLTTVVKGLRGTHKNFWECDTGIAYLVSGVPGWRSQPNRMTQVFDLSNPEQPVHIRDFGLPGQEPDATGPVPTALRGVISTGPAGNRVYFGYGTNRGGIVQIVDRDKLLKGPRTPTMEALVYPQIMRLDLPPTMGAHTAFPLLGVDIAEFARAPIGRVRDFVVVVNESLFPECLEARQMVWFVDVSHETRPLGVSSWTVPEKSGNFCSRGGRFGAHSSNQSFTPIYYKRIMFFAHFNAGVRAVDVRDPFSPREIAFYIPAITKNTVVLPAPAGLARSMPQTAISSRIAIQTNNVEVDDRGLIYIVDRANTGMHILELTGAARKIANFPKK